jgi:hypothetical protein
MATLMPSKEPLPKYDQRLIIPRRWILRGHNSGTSLTCDMVYHGLDIVLPRF